MLVGIGFHEVTVELRVERVVICREEDLPGLGERVAGAT